ncbi:hypothetical protein FGO68_gene8700 [Halteria grandinella]|uniref:Uncharacterized protein n=1 Tax=Halteria grandinella TaxID=5974 RepID=A0A8J8N9I8_HALGN|nr:hypothetical protein FGO68_gene8700 [Halteria grandinella]
MRTTRLMNVTAKQQTHPRQDLFSRCSPEFGSNIHKQITEVKTQKSAITNIHTVEINATMIETRSITLHVHVYMNNVHVFAQIHVHVQLHRIHGRPSLRDPSCQQDVHLNKQTIKVMHKPNN